MSKCEPAMAGSPSQFDRRVSFGKTAADYARYRAGFPEALFARLSAWDIGRAGQRVLDLGTGTGTLGRGFARRGCRVIGLDPSADLLAQARQIDRREGLATRYLVARAERVPLADDSLDVVAAGQCWHWFDRLAAAAEVWRLLVPGGRLVLAHFDWLPLAGSAARRTEDLIARYNPSWHFAGSTGLYPQWLPGLGEAGFHGLETFSFDVDVPYSHEAWRGRIRASAGVAATLAPTDVQRFDEELAALLEREFPAEPLTVPHRVFAIVAGRP